MALNARARSGTLPMTLVVMGVLAVIPFLPIPERMLSALTFALVYAIAAVGLDVFSGYSGQLSFGNFGFVALGAYTCAMLTAHAGWPVLATLPASILACAAASVVVGLPMIQLPGLGGALLTYFFAFVAVVLIGGQAFQDWTMGPNGIPVDTLQLGRLDFSKGKPLYYLGWLALLVVALVGDRYANSRAGKALRVIKRTEILAASMGIGVREAKLFAFIFSASVAGLGGWILAQALGYLSPESFSATESVNLVAMAVVGGLGSICGPIMGAVFFGVLSELTRGAGASRELVFALLLLAALVFLPGGLFSLFDLTFARVRRTPGAQAAHKPSRTAVTAAAAPLPVAAEQRTKTPLLEVAQVTVRFGGVIALDHVDLSVDRGEIYAIIGPNGAGKTTLLNCISGIQRYQGDIRLAGDSLHRMTPAQVRRAGVSRTFQHPSLVADLTVEENVATGTYGLHPATPYRDVLPLPRTIRRDREARRLAAEALDLVQFATGRRGVLAGDLALAEQKVVDIARSVAGSSRLLLLDEPTAGLDEHDIGHVVDVIRAVNTQTGLTILVIAHHVGFLRSIAGRSTVLDFGRVLAEGPIEDVTRREDVIKVFLG
jgi:branched-chain amino acid transport system permease protein